MTPVLDEVKVETTITHETALFDDEEPTPEISRKIAQIEKLARDEEVEGFGRVRCSCRHSWDDGDRRPSTEELRTRAAFLVKFPDHHSMAEHRRRVYMAILRADPTYAPPVEWCTGWLLEQVKRERASHASCQAL